LPAAAAAAAAVAWFACCSGEAHVLFNAGGGSNGSDLLLEVMHRPARHGEALYETLAGAPGCMERCSGWACK
jgi:hypothetical protein